MIEGGYLAANTAVYRRKSLYPARRPAFSEVIAVPIFRKVFHHFRHAVDLRGAIV
ncbi:MAG: hypothetical protein M3Y72_19620 [Acidobacteriota bacterium]|nr:hypothetical protein [Acidobacteriota bacterium]